jgi:hypothetical protein
MVQWTVFYVDKIGPDSESGFNLIVLLWSNLRNVADPHHIDADTDSSFHFDDPTFYVMRIRIGLF